MAIAVTRVFGPVSIGDRYMSVSTVALDNSYPTGGEALAASDLGFALTNDPEFHVVAHSTAGYVTEYDHTNKKLKVYRQKDPAAAGGADIALPEVGNTADLSAVTVRVTAYGKFRA